MKTKHSLAFIIVLSVLIVFPNYSQALSVRLIPNLTDISFWETSGVTTEYSFGISSSQLTTKLSDPLGGASNYDFSGVSTEYYDVFYSNSGGSFNLDGEYLTIEGVFGQQSPAGGGLNLAEIGLNFSSGPTPEYGNYVASYVALGNNAIPSSVGYAIDGNLSTNTTMGNTVGQSERLRVTLGFLSSSGPPPAPVPEPATMLLLGSGLIGLVGFRRRFKK